MAQQQERAAEQAELVELLQRKGGRRLKVVRETGRRARATVAEHRDHGHARDAQLGQLRRQRVEVVKPNRETVQDYEGQALRASSAAVMMVRVRHAEGCWLTALAVRGGEAGRLLLARDEWIRAGEQLGDASTSDRRHRHRDDSAFGHNLLDWLIT